nr:MAG TPA: DNA pilot protein VP2 [Microviridae sp.]
MSGFLLGLAQSAASSGSSSLGSSTGSGLGNAIFGGIAAKRQWKYAQKQMALQQQYALEQMAKSAEYQLKHDKSMFDYENAYNDPSKVFERFAKAGINPAAALGQSGASVGATIGTGSGSAPSAGGPSSNGSIGSSLAFSGDPTAIAQNALMDATKQKAKEDARLSAAEATRIERETQGEDHYRQMADLSRQLLQHKVTDQKAIAAYDGALARIQQSIAQYSDLTATYQFQQVVSDYARSVEEYRHLKALNDAEIPVMEQMVAANLSLMLAQAFAANSRGSLDRLLGEQAKINLADLENWFSVNWTTPVDVPEVDEKGRPTGETRKMTGKEIQEYLLGLSAASAGQELPANWFNIRSQKNQFGYSMAKTVIAAAAAAVASRGRGSAAPADFEQTTSHSDRYGEFIGGTSVRRSYIPRR